MTVTQTVQSHAKLVANLRAFIQHAWTGICFPAQMKCRRRARARGPCLHDTTAATAPSAAWVLEACSATQPHCSSGVQCSGMHAGMLPHRGSNPNISELLYCPTAYKCLRLGTEEKFSTDFVQLTLKADCGGLTVPSHHLHRDYHVQIPLKNSCATTNFYFHPPLN